MKATEILRQLLLEVVKVGLTQGTTPSLLFTTEVDLTTYDVVWLTITDQRGSEVTLTRDELDISPTTVSAVLSQEQTLKLYAGIIQMQFRAAMADGTNAIASDTVETKIAPILKGGVISEVPG